MAGDTDKLRTLSLFSGIGGIELGLRRWCRTVCYCEIDPYAAGSLVKNMAQGNLLLAPVWDDVGTFGEAEIAAVGPIECITGGFPCQDISCAGKGAGIVKGETRSGLFYEIIRIVRLARPRFIFLENVSTLLVRGMDTVLTGLAESGYDAVWTCLSAARIGANHKRLRWWLLAYPQCERQLQPQGGIEEKRGRAGDQGQDVADAQCDRREQGAEVFCAGKPVVTAGGQDVADAECERWQPGAGREGPGGIGGTEPVGGGTERAGADARSRRLPQRDGVRTRREETVAAIATPQWWAVEPDVGRVAHGVPFRVDRLRCLGNAVVPLCAAVAFELLLEEYFRINGTR